MDAEIEKKLREILNQVKMGQVYVPFKGSIDNDEAIKAIAELVVGTIPARTANDWPDDKKTFEQCRTEMLSRWTRKEKL